VARDEQSEQQANGNGDPFVGKRVPIAALRSPKVRAEVTAVRDLASSILSSQGLLERSQFGQDAHRAGYSYFDRATGRHLRDPFKELGYPSSSLSVADHRARYKFGGIARRLVNALPKAAWGRRLFVQDDPDPKNTTPFEQAVAALFKRLDVLAKLRRAHILASLGQYSALLIGAEGDLDKPLESVTAEGILYLTPFAEDRAEITKIVEEWRDPRFGLPEEYELDFGAPAMARKGGGRRASRGKRLVGKAHWSRVVHVVLDPLEDDVFGDPVLQAVWCYLDDLIKLVGGGAEAAWKRMDPGTILKLPFLPDSEFEAGQQVEFDEEEEEAVLAQFKLLRHGLERVIALRGVEAQTLDVSQVVFAASADKVLDLIAGTAGMPKRILLGSERGEQASTQDRSNWADRVQEYCEGPCETTLRAVVDRWIELGAVPEPADGEYEAIWAEIDELNSEEQAEMAGKIATANKSQQESEGRIIFTADEIRDRIFGLEPLAEVTEEGGEEGVDEDFAEEEEAELRAAADLANREAPEPEWRAVHRAADSRRLKLVAVFLALWAAAASQHLEAETLERFLENDSRVGAGRVVEATLKRAEAEFEEMLADELSATLTAGAEAALRSARGRGSWFRAAAEEDFRAAQFEGVFDATNPRALQWAADRSSALVKEIGPETRLALQDLIAAGFRDGLPPRVLAQRIRESVGLLSRQVGAVERLRAQLYGAKPGDLITRFPPRPGVRKLAGFRVRVPAGGLTNAQVNKLAAKYSRMHLNLRARTIARTECLRAANEGQRELWRQARDEGHLPRNQHRVWIATPDDRVRPEHADRDGYVVGLEEEWPWGTEPGAEPNCRCAQGLTDQAP
jgi:SPP1 gp7 family putative phage head morphogenesis protein